MAQEWNAEFYGRTSRYVSDLGAGVLDWLDPQRGERVLDLGCGDGALTTELLARGCTVIGVDSSESMVRSARQTGIDARLGDARSLEFEDEFDAVFSNAALHWVQDASSAASAVRRALADGGRFVGEFGGEGNVAQVFAALKTVLARRGLDAAERSPWYFPSPEQYAQVLAEAGFRVVRIGLFDRPTPIPGDAAEWLENFGGAFLAGLPADDKRTAVQEANDLLRASLSDADGAWTIDYVRLRFEAVAVSS